MLNVLVAFLVSLIVTYLIIRFEHIHGHLTGDWDFTSAQKFHNKAVPRIGGIGIFFGLIAALLAHIILNQQFNSPLEIILCSTPVFLIGLCEDITKKISANTRLAVIATSAFLSVQVMNISITSIDIPIVDAILSISLISIIFTIFAITGLSNAYNIIDGFNGLSSMVGMLTLCGLAYVCYLNSDIYLMYLSVLMTVVIFGFFVWNYPKGLIFLGDGGAYLLGFWIATISILLVIRHQTITPWFALLINGYPIMETIFTIYRRKIHKKNNYSQADGMHLHTLVFRRLIISNGSKTFKFLNKNSRTSPLLWMLSILIILPAILFRESTLFSIITLIIISIFYIRIYQSIVKFHTPAWLKKI